MNPRQTSNLIDQVFTTAARLGGTVPKGLSEEHKKFVRLAEAVSSIELPIDVPGAVLDALEAGNDPTTDTAVLKAVVGREISMASHGLADRLGERGRAFLAGNGEELLAMFDKPFDTAAQTLITAAEHLGDVDLDDTRAVLSKGGDAAQVWAAAQEAEKTLSSIHSMWRQVAGYLPGVSADNRYALLVIADIDPSHYLAEGLNVTGVRLRPFEIARRGHRLSLASPGIHAERIKAVQNQIQANSMEYDENASRAVRQHYAHTVLR